MVNNIKHIAMKIYFSIISLIVIFASYSCSEEDINKAYGPNDGTPPGKVEMQSYKALPGGVNITIKAPADEDLMYVKVKYTLDSGQEMEQRVSAYSSQITIEGFGNTSEKSLSFSAVDRMENEGEISHYTVIPGEPSYVQAYESLDMFVTFSGIGVKLNNDNFSNLIVKVLTTDSIGEWYTAHTEYTSKKDISFAVRGFGVEPRQFATYITDPWGNKSDTSYIEVEPWYETELDKAKFSEMFLANDFKVNYWGWSMSHIWDGNNIYGANNMCHSSDQDGWPQWFTFDLGVTAQLSRYKYWQRLQEEYLYQHGNLKKWEIYGRADRPDASGSWDGWILLATCESKKPSGLPPGTVTSEDIEYASAGEEFEFPLDTPPVRYIRWKGLETFTGGTFIHLQEVTFYGSIVK